MSEKGIKSLCSGKSLKVVINLSTLDKHIAGADHGSRDSEFCKKLYTKSNKR